MSTPGAGPVQSGELRLLSDLWLREPDTATVGLAATRLGLPMSEPGELATAYAELFLLNVFPYGTVFTDPYGELNGSGAQHVAALFEAYGYQPAALSEIAAPDHLGLCLGFAAHLREGQKDILEFLPALAVWAPVCCLAVEREPSVHPFYRGLAQLTRVCLLANDSLPDGATHADEPMLLRLSRGADEEVRLRDLVRFFLAPARCGIFLSRGHLGQIGLSLGLRLPFGSRFEVAEALFQAAGESEHIKPLIAALEAEIDLWRGEYAHWAGEQPGWQAAAGAWIARTARAAEQLREMRLIIERFPKSG